MSCGKSLSHHYHIVITLAAAKRRQFHDRVSADAGEISTLHCEMTALMGRVFAQFFLFWFFAQGSLVISGL
jgi:hypothetical protein